MSDWTTIPDTDCDADSPVDEDLVLDLKENVEYLHERAVRAGTHGTGVRLAIARGTVADTALTDTGGETGPESAAVVFSTDADDGNPNFSAAPIVVISGEETAAGGGLTAWPDQAIFTYQLQASSLSTSGFTIYWEIINGGNTVTHGVTFHWIALGAVSTGE